SAKRKTGIVQAWAALARLNKKARPRRRDMAAGNAGLGQKVAAIAGKSRLSPALPRGILPSLSMSLPVTNISAYRFAPLTDLKALRSRLLETGRELGLKGTILLS